MTEPKNTIINLTGAGSRWQRLDARPARADRPVDGPEQQYINLPPVKTLDGVASPLEAKHPIDLRIARKNNEGEYSEVGGRMYRGLPHQSAVQETIFTRGTSSTSEFTAAALTAIDALTPVTA